MEIAVLIAITLLCIAWSLWIRRVTWTCRWEVAATLNIAFQGGAILLMSPLASDTVGRALHAVTGMWNLEDFVGHDLYIVAASAIVYNAVGRLQDDHQMQRAFRQYVELPATLCIPLLLAAFSLSSAHNVYARDFFASPTDGWLSLYWVILGGILIYLLGYGARALLVLRKDPRSRRIANVYLVACASGIIACIIRIMSAVFPAFLAWERGVFVWVFACACGAGFALSSAHSWRIKTRWFTKVDR